MLPSCFSPGCDIVERVGRNDLTPVSGDEDIVAARASRHPFVDLREVGELHLGSSTIGRPEACLLNELDHLPERPTRCSAELLAEDVSLRVVRAGHATVFDSDGLDDFFDPLFVLGILHGLVPHDV